MAALMLSMHNVPIFGFLINILFFSTAFGLVLRSTIDDHSSTQSERDSSSSSSAFSHWSGLQIAAVCIGGVIFSCFAVGTIIALSNVLRRHLSPHWRKLHVNARAARRTRRADQRMTQLAHYSEIELQSRPPAPVSRNPFGDENAIPAPQPAVTDSSPRFVPIDFSPNLARASQIPTHLGRTRLYGVNVLGEPATSIRDLRPTVHDDLEDHGSELFQEQAVFGESPRLGGRATRPKRPITVIRNRNLFDD